MDTFWKWASQTVVPAVKHTARKRLMRYLEKWGLLPPAVQTAGEQMISQILPVTMKAKKREFMSGILKDCFVEGGIVSWFEDNKKCIAIAHVVRNYIRERVNLNEIPDFEEEQALIQFHRQILQQIKMARRDDSQTPHLIKAIKANDLPSVINAIHCGADVMSQGYEESWFRYYWSVLHIAAYYGHYGLIPTLVAENAKLLELRDSFGRTPLLVAIFDGITDNADLKDIGGKLAPDIYRNLVETVKVLLERGANPNQFADIWGYGQPKFDTDCFNNATALHIAARLGLEEMVDVLISRPDTTYRLPNKDGQIALDCARKRNLPELIHKLEAMVEKEKKEHPPGLIYQKVPGDDHCFYHAVGLYTQLEQQVLRNQVADYLEQYFELFEEFIDLPREAYLRGIRTGHAWADQVEITVLMRILNRPIAVIGPLQELRNVDDIQGYDAEPIFVFYDGIAHYDAYVLDNTVPAQDILMQLTHPIPISNNEVVLFSSTSLSIRN